jgi:arabinose-5-phosphate isomerase
MKEAVDEMSDKNLGVTLVLDREDVLIGIITDGDLRRLMGYKGNILEKPVNEVMSLNPKTIDGSKLAGQALEEMEKRRITSLAIVDGDKKIKGIVHLHDLLGRGEFKFRF